MSNPGRQAPLCYIGAIEPERLSCRRIRNGPTELLRAWSQGDGSALDRLMPLVYDELHGLAQRYMRQERPDHTLQATSLVNEAYLRLIDVNRVEFQNRTHFLALAAQMMRWILVEFARHRHRQKRGGRAVHLSSMTCSSCRRHRSATSSLSAMPSPGWRRSMRV